MCTQKMRALSYIGAEKITFSPKPDRQTYIQTDRRTDISVYRVALLLKNILEPTFQDYPQPEPKHNENWRLICPRLKYCIISKMFNTQELKKTILKDLQRKD